LAGQRALALNFHPEDVPRTTGTIPKALVYSRPAHAEVTVKTVTDAQLRGELGETLVKARFYRLGLAFEGRGRLETGINGTIELRDQVTGRMLGKIVAV
jgi:hypothetical protein